MKRYGSAVAGVLALVTFQLGGCSSVINKGGDTTCGEFKNQDTKKQESEISKMLKDSKGQEPSGFEISATRLTVEAYCKTFGTESSKISDVNHG